MKKFIFLFFSLFLLASVGVCGQNKPNTYTLILPDGHTSFSWTHKVETGYYIGDTPVYKRVTDSGDNSDKIKKWLERRVYKQIEVYCADFSFSDSLVTMNGKKHFYNTSGVIEIIKDYAKGYRPASDRPELITKPLTDSLKVAFGVTRGKCPVVIVGEENDNPSIYAY